MDILLVNLSVNVRSYWYLSVYERFYCELRGGNTCTGMRVLSVFVMVSGIFCFIHFI